MLPLLVILLFTLPARHCGALPPDPGAPVPPTPPAGTNRADLQRAYASALQYLAPGLKAAQAELLGRTIIDASNRHDLDARLVMAMVGVERLMPQVQVKGGELRIGIRPAAAVLEALARDIRARLAARVTRGELTKATIQGALVSRGEKLHAGEKQARRSATRYSKQVSRLYEQFCGIEAGRGAPDDAASP